MKPAHTLGPAQFNIRIRMGILGIKINKKKGQGYKKNTKPNSYLNTT